MSMQLSFISILSLSLLLSGCSRDTPEAMLDNYLYRLSNTLDLPQPKTYEPKVRLLFPAKRERILNTTEIREGLLDVLKLERCNLLPLIAQRNSSLGKVATPSIKLGYELKFYSLLNQCRRSLSANIDIDTKLLARINEIYTVKRNNLAAELWNGIYTSEAIELNFSLRQLPLPLQDNGSPQQTIKALEILVALTSFTLDEYETVTINIEQLDSAINTLHSNRSGSEIFSSLEILTYYLQRATQLLDQAHLNNQLQCYSSRPSRQAKILENVFRKFYIGEVQTYLGMSHRYASQWLELNTRLLNNLKQFNLSIPKGMETYSTALLSKTTANSLWSNYTQARNKHTRAWQKLLKQCGLMPTTTN